MYRLRNAIVATLCLVMLAGVTPAAEASPDPKKAKQFIREGIVRSLRLLEDESLSRSMVTSRIRAELTESFDIGTIAGYALGPLRSDMSPDQERRYLDEFRGWIGETLTTLVFGLRSERRTMSPDAITLTGTTPLSADQIFVHSRVRQPDSRSTEVHWRLRKKGERFLVLDMVVYSVSLAELVRSQFAAIVSRENRGVEGLIAELKQKNALLTRN